MRKMRNRIKLQPKIVVIISIIIGIVMITSAYFELSESKKDIFRVLSKQSNSLIETVSFSSINALNSSEEIENLIGQRLLNNAYQIKRLDSLNLLTKNVLKQISKENDLFRINIFDKLGKQILSNREQQKDHLHPERPINRYGELKPILKGEEKEMIIGLHNALHEKGERYAVAVSRAFNRGAIVINLDAKDFVEFRKKIGIGKIIKDIANNAGIEYVILQDTAGILAASSSVNSIEKIEGDSFLESAAKLDSTFFRINEFKNHEVYEVVKRLIVSGEFIGLFRLGISLDEVKSVEAKMYRRIIIISFLLAAISIIVLSIIFTAQNLRALSDQFKKFKTFTGSILEKMGEAVIVIDNQFNVNLFNDTAEKLFKLKREVVIDNLLTELLEGKLNFIIEEIYKMNSNSSEIIKNVIIEDETKYLSINITKNFNEQNEIESYTIVLNDYTNQKILEDQSKRNEKLSAMGELASGVAHEIRNPINAIGMIAQRLNKEFIPKKDSEEFKRITGVLNEEVARINKIILQFLDYAKPIEIQKRELDAKKYFDDIYSLFTSEAIINKNRFVKLSDESFIIKIDPELMKQTLINIIQNAFEALNEGGQVSLNYKYDQEFLKIEIEDNGKGISEEQLKKIFDLYFTTKTNGNGLGLSIAQKIVSQHNGTIKVESKLNKGTKFKIFLPAL